MTKLTQDEIAEEDHQFFKITKAANKIRDNSTGMSFINAFMFAAIAAGDVSNYKYSLKTLDADKGIYIVEGTEGDELSIIKFANLHGTREHLAEKLKDFRL